MSVAPRVSPNPRLQRTPSAAPPSPLSHKPLGATQGTSSRKPVSGSLLVVREGQDMNDVGGFEIDHLVWKAFDRRSTHGKLRWNSWDGRSSFRETTDLVECGVYRGKKSTSETGPPFLVLVGGVIELLVGLVLCPKGPFHRFVRFASARRRTSSQGTPTDSPLRTLRARRSISAAHAASTSALSSGAASRLSRSSTATLARSSGLSFRASSRTSLTLAMNAILPLGRVTPNPPLQRTRVARSARNRSPLNGKPLGGESTMSACVPRRRMA